MKLNVAYSGQARAIAGRASEVIEVSPASTLHDVVDAIAARHGGAMAALLEHKQRGAPAILVFVGNQQVRWDVPPALKDSDEITLVSPISGG
jgi:molybdopterin converting factor small subunit